MDSMSRIKVLKNSLTNMSTETKTGIILAITFFFSLFLSLYFVIGPSVKAQYAVSGGSDAYYNMRIVQYILSTHHQLLFDPSLNFPIGLENPRPPLFHWLIVLLGYAFSPFLGGVFKSTMTMFIASTAIGGAFIVFPTYYLGKELFGYKVGLLAAVLVAMSPLTLMKSIGTIGLFDIYTALFGLMFIYFFLRAVNTFKFDAPDMPIVKSIVPSIRSNPISVIYALLAGVSLAASLLTWVGSISLMLILVGASVLQLAIFAIKKKNSLGIFVSNLFFGSAFIIAFPWYYVAHFIPIRFDYPLMMWGILLLVSIYFLFLQKRPWLLSIGLFIVLAAAGIALLYKFDNTILKSILSGQHYFVKNKIYDTIAEAQALPLGEDLLEFGAFTFFASFIGLAYLVYKWIRTATFNMTLAILYFGGIIVISMIASKFLYFGATAASILTGYIVVRAFELLSFKEAVDKSKGRSIKTALRREFKFAHYAAILIVVFLLIVPTTFYAVDSAIPYNNKTSYDRQLYNDTPNFLKPANYSAPYYLGAFGAAMATPQQPWNRALVWFQNQDANQSPNQRPAFISWWDYGFQTLEQGNHPVMADNFQDGVYPAAQILLAQNESEMLSVMITQMLYNYTVTGNFNNSPILPLLNDYLGQNGTNLVMSYMANPSNSHQDGMIAQINANPSYYGQHQSIQRGDAVYIIMEHFLTNTYSLATLINLYSAVEQFMSKYMSYVAVDYSLFPFNGTNTGIFYAPSYLGDFPYVNASGEIVPTEFYNINVTDTSGNTYAIQNFPSGDTAASYNISYTPQFYNTTIYRGFIGYPPSTIGSTNGIPGYSSGLSSYPAMQGWGMSNFEVAYKTVLWNPYTDYQNHSSAWKEVSLEQGYQYLKNHDGTTDLFPPSYILSSDVVFLQYYPGAIISGRVYDNSGQPVQGARVTVTDQYGIPHETVLTNSTGYYSIYAVAGNDTITYSTGAYNQLYMVGSKTLGYYNVTISNAQADRLSYNNYGPTWNITHNLVINSTDVNGLAFLNIAKISTFTNPDQPINGTVKFYNATYNRAYYTTTSPNGTYHFSNVAPYSYEISVYTEGKWYNNISSVTVSDSTVSHDIPMTYGTLNATLASGNSISPGANITFSRGNYSKTYNLTKPAQLFELPPGVFNVSATSSGQWDNFTTRVTNNTTTRLDLSFSRTYKITFITEVDGHVVSAPIQINNGSGNLSTQTVLTNSQGIGYYSSPVSTNTFYTDILFDGSYYSASGILNVSGAKTVLLNLLRSYLVTGQYTVSNTTQSYTHISITGSNTLVSLYGNNTGHFAIYLPPGDYSVVTHSQYNASLYVASLYFTLGDQTQYLNLKGNLGQQLDGTVTSNGTTVKGLLTTQMGSGPYYDSFVGSNGSYSIYLYDGASLSSTGFISPGYTVQSSSPTNIELQALPVNVSVYASYSGSVPINLYLNGTQDYVISGTHYFNLTMLPGNYSMTFSHPGTGVTSSQNIITVGPGASPQGFTASLSVMARLNVDPVQEVYVFSNGTLVSTTLNTTLPVGTYTIYAYSGTTAALEKIYLTKDTNISLNFKTAYNVTLSASPSGNVNIGSSSGNVSWGGSILLPKGTYSFTLEKNFNTSYIYYASTTSYISSPQSITLKGVLVEALSNVSMNFTYGGSTLNAGTYYIQGPKNVTGMVGSETISLPRGNYSIYVTSGNLAYFGGFDLKSTGLNLNIALHKAYPLNYGTYLNNSSYSGMVSIKSDAPYYLHSSGIINLPNGTYTFSATTTYSNYGYLDNYSINQNVKVSGISSATLAFKLNLIVKASFYAESGQPLLSAGQSYTFPLLITNHANVPLKFTIGNSSTFYVSGNAITLLPNTSGETNVTIKIPSGATAGSQSVDVRVYFGNTFQNVQVNFTVNKVQDITAKLSNSTGKVVGNVLEIPLTIYNTGNVLTAINASILDQGLLTSNGIMATFNNSGNFTTYLASGRNNTTYIFINSTSGKSLAGQEISVLISYGNTTKIVTVTLATPQLKLSTGTGTGHDLSPYSHLTQDYYIYAFSAFIVLAMVAVMLIFRRRFRS